MRCDCSFGTEDGLEHHVVGILAPARARGQMQLRLLAAGHHKLPGVVRRGRRHARKRRGIAGKSRSKLNLQRCKLGSMRCNQPIKMHLRGLDLVLHHIGRQQPAWAARIIQIARRGVVCAAQQAPFKQIVLQLEILECCHELRIIVHCRRRGSIEILHRGFAQALVCDPRRLELDPDVLAAQRCRQIARWAPRIDRRGRGVDLGLREPAIVVAALGEQGLEARNDLDLRVVGVLVPLETHQFLLQGQKARRVLRMSLLQPIESHCRIALANQLVLQRCDFVQNRRAPTALHQIPLERRLELADHAFEIEPVHIVARKLGL
eukprot:comp21278_c0_seq1/m.45573 comp21278_c0_seq1/g.45573  ORF comp21278_c0_seq1/g.45573 comp21278_c0_seq1/m.45573 type:complete len:320 (+) comp21278_c0_seq1:50-1009(+)